MKVITLNIWGGKIHLPLLEFLAQQAPTTDIFCFQEVFFGESDAFSIQGTVPDIFSQLCSTLIKFNPYIRIAPEGSLFQGESTLGTKIGLVIFVKQWIQVTTEGGLFTYDQEDEFAKNPQLTMTGNFQYVILDVADKGCLIGNLHGVWQTEGKGDTVVRLKQTQLLRNFLAQQKIHMIICGDFNMLPDTESMSQLQDGMRNLVVEQGIRSTRSKLYTKPEQFADYVLISPKIKAQHFIVPDVTVSDHLPLILECSL